MVSAPPTPPSAWKPALRAILWGGVAAGTLDILAAFLLTLSRGNKPIGVLKAIASGVLGAAAFAGGAGVATLGLMLHFTIALGAAAVFVGLARRFRALTAHPFVTGPLYGVAVYLFMNLVVLPLSAISFTPQYTIPGVLTMLGIHMVCVGLPIVLVARRYAGGESARPHRTRPGLSRTKAAQFFD